MHLDSVFHLFLIITAGYVIGNFKIKGFSLDVSAILLVALTAGHLGVSIPEEFKYFGLAIFIYSIGLQSGPGFFETIKNKGLKLNLIAASFVVLIFAEIFIFSWFYGFDETVRAGMLTGTMTSAPALAASLEVNNAPTISVIFGVVYPFCIMLTIMYPKIVPRLLKLDLAQEKRIYEETLKDMYPPIVTKNFKITNENFKRQSITKSEIQEMTQTNIERIESDYDINESEVDHTLHYGDIVRVTGTKDQLDKVKVVLGEEVNEPVTFHDNLKVLRLLVTNKNIVGKKISDLKELNAMGASISKVRRSGIDINPGPHLILMLGDKLYITVPEKFEKKVTNFIGDNLLNFPAGDFLPISLGIVIGMIIGFMPFNIPGVGEFRLSFVGGILITALVLGRLGRTGKLVWQLSPHSTSLMKTLGQLIFLATIGTEAGKDFLTSMDMTGLVAVLFSVFSLLITFVVFTLVMFKILKYNVLDVLGVFAGSMTSTPALSMATEICDSNRPAVAYAAVYPFALILTIFLAQVAL